MNPTSFQLGMYRQIVVEHAETSEHTAYCCGIVESYTEILKSQPTGIENRPASTTSRVQHSSNERMASEPQAKYVRSLMASRKISVVEMASWGAMLEQGLTWDQAVMIIDTLKERAVADGRTRMATSPQLDYIRNLLNSSARDEDVDFESLTFSAARDLINRLKAEAESGTATEGVYFYEGTYVKVQRAVHGSRQLYTKAFDTETQSWDRAYKLLGKLKPEHKLTREQASAFGDLYGQCVRCARILTDEFSIEHGYGPICAEKMGL